MTLARRTVAALARRGLRVAGYELHRLPPSGHVWGRDPFDDQRELFRGREVRTVFDVGANVGQTVARYRDLFPTADVHAFEPFPETFDELRRSHAADPRVHPHRLAVADRAGPATLHANRSHYTNSLLPAAPGVERYVGPGLIEPVGRVDVDAVRLDDFCEARGIDRIDVLKIDVQGGEGLVLTGADRLLARRAVRLVYVEVQIAPMYVGQATLWDVQRAFDAAGYRLFGIYNVVHAGREGVAWADVIYRPTDPPAGVN